MSQGIEMDANISVKVRFLQTYDTMQFKTMIGEQILKQGESLVIDTPAKCHIEVLEASTQIRELHMSEIDEFSIEQLIEAHGKIVEKIHDELSRWDGHYCED